MKTPIQELKEQLVEEDIRCLTIDYYLEKEKEFAKQCFEAGRSQSWDEGGTGCLEFDFNDFEEFYKQFEQ